MPPVNDTSIVRNLSCFDVQACALIAERRNVVKNVHGVKNKRYGQQTDFATHLNGVYGEYVVCDMFGKRPDTSVSLSGDDKVSDIVIDGVRIQIKSRLRTHTNGLYLFFDTLDLFRADIAVLTTLRDAATVAIEGWILREDFIEKHEVVNFGYGDRVAVEKSFLNPASTLVSAVRSFSEGTPRETESAAT
jgi:hypothetical protein